MLTDINYIHPKRIWYSKILELIANNEIIRGMRRTIFNYIPFLKLKSNVTGIVYLNWLIDIESIRELLPNNIELANFNGKTLLTIMTYKHNNFAPVISWFVARIFPSPLQNCWRLYVNKVNNQQVNNTVLYLSNTVDQLLFALGIRVFSDSMLIHLPKEFKYQIDQTKAKLKIDPGISNSPEFTYSGIFSFSNKLTPEFEKVFGSWQNAIDYICLQQAVITPLKINKVNTLCKSSIQLTMNTKEAQQLINCNFKSTSALTNKNEVFAFYIPKAQFKALNEEILHR